jgi:hypothetical protein
MKMKLGVKSITPVLNDVHVICRENARQSRASDSDTYSFNLSR